MSLKSLIDNDKSDKDTIHSYIDLYDDLLKDKKYTALNVCEIGILKGGSIKLWKDYFPNATVYGLDIKDNTNNWDGVKDERIKLIFDGSAYNQKYIDRHFKDVKFDFILDDASHTLQAQKDCIKYYLPLLKDDGILIIEDVEKPEWFYDLENETPDIYKNYIDFYDRRHIKDRYDDLVFVINKSKNALKTVFIHLNTDAVDVIREASTGLHEYLAKH